MEQISRSTGSKAKNRLKSLIVLLGLGIALMLLSHLYSGAHKTTSTSLNASTSKTSKQGPTQPASLLQSNHSNTPQTLNDYETYYEDRLTKMLDNMAGISNASVMVTLSTGPEKVYQQDTKTSDQRSTQHDSSGGTQTTTNQTTDKTTVMVNQNGQNGPILITQKGPSFKAILVVANGVSHPSMKERVINAVSTVLDVPSYKVSVQERK